MHVIACYSILQHIISYHYHIISLSYHIISFSYHIISLSYHIISYHICNACKLSQLSGLHPIMVLEIRSFFSTTGGFYAVGFFNTQDYFRYRRMAQFNLPTEQRTLLFNFHGILVDETDFGRKRR